MKQLSSWAAAYVTPLFVLLVTISVLMIGASEAWAYSTYSTDIGSTGNCASCHGAFAGVPYVSLSDGANWGDDLHDVHRDDMLTGECDTCHSTGGSTVVLGASSRGIRTSAVCLVCSLRSTCPCQDQTAANRRFGTAKQVYLLCCIASSVCHR